MTIQNRRQILVSAFALAAGVAGLTRSAHASSEQQAKDMVAKAIALHAEKGEAAFAILNEGKASGFADGEIYIVVQSRGAEGKVLAHGADAKMVGTPLSEISDQNGLKFAEVMSVEATAAGSWFEYDWLNPETGVVSKKKSWAILVGDIIFLAGIYVN
jgi:signal transduction histidine kinase